MSDLPRIRTVLVSTDFSELANRAIPYAYATVADGGTVHLVHVLELPDVPGPLVPHYTRGHVLSAEDRTKLHADLSERLRKLPPVTADARGIRSEPHVVDERGVSWGLVQLARQLSADLICIASHGHSALFKSLLGSVSDQVLHDSPCPVLVVPAGRQHARD